MLGAVFNAEPCELKVSRGGMRRNYLKSRHRADGSDGQISTLVLSSQRCWREPTFLRLSAEESSPSSRRTRSVSGVAQLSRQQVIIWDDAKQKAVITLEFRTAVLRVRLSRSRIVVALLNSVHVYAFSSPPQKLSVFETTDNTWGLCCLGSKIIAFPGLSSGQVQLVEIETGNVSIIPAHGNPLRALELSPDGQVLATASETVSHKEASKPKNSTDITSLGHLNPRLLNRKLCPPRRTP